MFAPPFCLCAPFGPAISGPGASATEIRQPHSAGRSLGGSGGNGRSDCEGADKRGDASARGAAAVCGVSFGGVPRRCFGCLRIGPQRVRGARRTLRRAVRLRAWHSRSVMAETWTSAAR